jgi:hypothetical protein
MSILNRPSDGLVSVLIATVRSSVLLGSMPKNKLLDVCSPKSFGDGRQDMAIKSLNRWIELGLFTVSEQDDVKVADEFRGRLKKANGTTEAIAEVCRQIVLSPANNKNFWSDEENRSADFSRAASWMLAQDVHQFAPTSYSQVEPRALEQGNSAEVILFQNDTRWSGYVSWATFLGFGRSESGKASGGFITDPTLAVVGVAKSLLPKQKLVPIREFLDGLSESVPVLDGGEYRREVEGKLRPEKWKSPASMDVSTSLSRALLRLHAQGVLRLEKRSDSDAQVRLIGRGERFLQSVTHIQIGDAT